jgi:hypothetical protein
MHPAAQTASAGLRKDQRRAKRQRTRAEVTVEYLGRSIAGSIHDISTTGIAVNMRHVFFGGIGGRVKISSKELGSLEGVIQWNNEGRIGVEFSKSSNAAAQVEQYFRFYHQAKAPAAR